MITVLTDVSSVDTNAGRIILESDATGVQAYAELQGPDARRLAVKAASDMGLPDPRVSGSVDIYPVDKEGNEITDLKIPVDKIRGEVPVTRRLI